MIGAPPMKELRLFIFVVGSWCEAFALDRLYS